MGSWSKPAVRCNLIGHAAEFAAGSGKKHAAGNVELVRHESGRRQDAGACPGDSERPAMKLRWPWRKKREGWTCKKIQLFYRDYVDDELSVCDRFDYEVHLATCEKCRNYVGSMLEVIPAIAEEARQALRARSGANPDTAKDHRCRREASNRGQAGPYRVRATVRGGGTAQGREAAPQGNGTRENEKRKAELIVRHP